MLEGERPLELQAGQRALLVEHLARHREPALSRQVEQRRRPAQRARQGREPWPGLGGQREDGEEATLAARTQAVRRPAVRSEDVVRLGRLGVQGGVVAVGWRRLRRSGVEERPHGGEERRPVQADRRPARDPALTLHERPALIEHRLGLAPRPGGVLETRGGSAPAGQSPPSGPRPRHRGPVADREEDPDVPHGHEAWGRRRQRADPGPHHPAEEWVAAVRGCADPACELRRIGGLVHEDDLERDARGEARQKSVEGPRHRLALLRREEFRVEEGEAPREPQAAVGQHVDRARVHPPPWQQLGERRRVGVQGRDGLVGPGVHESAPQRGLGGAGLGPAIRDG